MKNDKLTSLVVIKFVLQFRVKFVALLCKEIDGMIEQVWPLDPEWAQNLRKMTDILIANF